MLPNNSVSETRSVPLTQPLEAAQTTINPLQARVPEQEFSFADGLLGFPQWRRYRLEPYRPTDGTQTPFFVLRCLDEDLSFPVIRPASLGIDYQVPADPELLSALGAAAPDALKVLLIVTVGDRVEDTTVNLQGPLVINTATAKGLQLIVEQYPLQHQMLVQTEH